MFLHRLHIAELEGQCDSSLMDHRTVCAERKQRNFDLPKNGTNQDRVQNVLKMISERPPAGNGLAGNVSSLPSTCLQASLGYDDAGRKLIGTQFVHVELGGLQWCRLSAEKQ